jgi:hypothetical protein
MKTLPVILAATAFILASCGSSRYSAYGDYDDVYYNPATDPNAVPAVTQTTTTYEPAITPEKAMAARPYEDTAYSTQELSDYEKYRMQMESEMMGESYDTEGSESMYNEQYNENYSDVQGEEKAPVIINNNYYGTDDYYYSSRIRRFSDNFYGWDYYDPYYTNLHFYTGIPYGWGFSMSYGYPYYSYGFSPYSYYSPYWHGGWYPGYYGSWYGNYYPGYYPWSYYGYDWYSPYYSYYPYSRYYHSGYYPGHYYTTGSDYGSYYNGRLPSRSTYGYSSYGVYSRTQARKQATTVGNPNYRSRSTVRTAGSTGDTRDKTYRDPRTETKSITGGATGDRDGRNINTTTTTREREITPGNPADRNDRGNHYGNDRQDNNFRDRGNQDPHNTGNRTGGNTGNDSGNSNRGNHYGNDAPDNNPRDRGNQNPHDNDGNKINRGTGNDNRGGNAGREIQTTRPSTTTKSYVPRQSAASSQGSTYRPSYTKPRTSSTPSYNREQNTNTQRSVGTTQPVRRTYTRPSTSSSSSYSRPSTTTRSSSSYSRPSTTTRSSSSYSRPSTSSRSSSSYSAPSSSSRSSFSSGSRSSSSSSRSSSSSSRSSSPSSRSSSRR